MRVDAFDFDLPQDLIALRPASPRDSARLLDVRPQGLADRIVHDLPDLLRAGDCLVLNNTRVIPARLSGRRVGRGDAEPRIEATLHQRRGSNVWAAFAKPGRKLAVGDRVRFGGEGAACLAGTLDATVRAKGEGGEIELAFDLDGPALDSAVAVQGVMPLPPYIAARRAADARDQADYQTVYAKDEGAVAAPTAGLHFTDKLFQRLDDKGVQTEFVTLHVGAGTFLPVKADDTADHRMHSEWGVVSGEVADRLNACRAAGGRIISVGTTSLRLLESAARSGAIEPFSGDTDIFITPGYRFQAVDMLLTNFHLPRSTLFMLVSAFSGLDRMQAAYAYAIAQGYRFYSYGDACLLDLAGSD
ncbi:MAG: tRNA preQ1(34) S-adenosylmethionine ribosyltransferase-isomerase QueA [Pseudomonadota bacterium]